jgi:hypothetical protein
MHPTRGDVFASIYGDSVFIRAVLEGLRLGYFSRSPA